MDWDMLRTKELPLIPVSGSLLEDDLQVRPHLKQSPTYTVTFSFSFGTAMGLGDTVVGIVVLRIVSIVIAAGGFIISLAVILLAPYFPSLVSAAPLPASSSQGGPRAASSRHRPAPVAVQVTVRRDPNVTSIIERHDSASPSPAPPNRRVSFSPQSSSTSVPNPSPEIPSAPGSSTGHAHVMPSPGPSMRSLCDRVRDREREPAYILPTPPASIASVSSEGDDAETLVEFGVVSASPSVGKRGRSFPFVGRRKDKGNMVRDGSVGQSESGLFGSRKRSQSLRYVVPGSAGGLSRANTTGALNSAQSRERAPSEISESVPESETEGSTRGTDKDDRASRSPVDKEARRRSGLSFQDFKAAFGKRERRGSSTVGTHVLSSHPAADTTTTPAESENPFGRALRSPQPHSALGGSRPSSVQISPRAPLDSAASARRRSLPLRLNTETKMDGAERTEAQSPLQQRSLFGGGEVVIRNESGRLRTRTSAIPGLYANAEVLQRL